MRREPALAVGVIGREIAEPERLEMPVAEIASIYESG